MPDAGGGRPAPASLVRRAVDLTYDNKQRASSLRWALVNGFLFVLLSYDLWHACSPGRWSGAAALQGAATLALGVALATHALRLARGARGAPGTAAITDTQRRLLGLSLSDLDSSFRLVPERASPSPSPSGGALSPRDELMSLSLSRSWHSSREDEHSPRRSPLHSPLHSSLHSPAHCEPQDRFIADRKQLSDYLREYEARELLESGTESGAAAGGAGWAAAAAADGARALHRPYQIASRLESLDESAEGSGEGGVARAGAGAGGARGAGGAGACWAWLHALPDRGALCELRARRYVHATVLQRVVEHAARVSHHMHQQGLADFTLGEVSVERVRATAESALGAGGGAAAGGAGQGAPSLRALLPFLEPFADQRYLLQRLTELAAGGCLSAFRWSGGGGGWDRAKPTDAEIVMHLFVTYLDSQLPGGGEPRPFSRHHYSAAPPAPPAAAPSAGAPLAAPAGPVIHRAEAHPPHYVLSVKGHVIEVCRGRTNLFHCLLLFVRLAARGGGALRRVSLGRAGLNLLWLLGDEQL